MSHYTSGDKTALWEEAGQSKTWNLSRAELLPYRWAVTKMGCRGHLKGTFPISQEQECE